MAIGSFPISILNQEKSVPHFPSPRPNHYPLITNHSSLLTYKQPCPPISFQFFRKSTAHCAHGRLCHPLRYASAGLPR